jgi:lactoylglutathione lyase
MHIDHIAIWVNDLENMKNFYTRIFEVRSNQKYVNHKKEYSSYFLSFASGTRIELMKRSDIKAKTNRVINQTGFAHMAISVGSIAKVDEITKQIRNLGHKIVSEPRTTGDGYYECVISDPEGNSIEITV